MTLASRKEVAKILIKIVNDELGRKWGTNTLLSRGVRVLAERLDKMGITPEDVLTPSGRDAVVAVANVTLVGGFARAGAMPVGAEWQTVIAMMLAARRGDGDGMAA